MYIRGGENVKLKWFSIGMIMLAASGCLSVSGDVPEACIHWSQVTIPGAPISAGEVSKSFVQEDFGYDVPEEADAEVYFVEATLSMQQGSFSFVDEINLTIQSLDANANVSPLRLVDYIKDAQTAEAQALNFPGTGEDNLISYVETNSIEFVLDIKGDVPTQDWQVDLDTCLSASGGYRVF